MLFIDNKYSRIYFLIITRSSTRNITGYTEKHHIIPKSIGGLDNDDNIAILTAREHYICHLLLTKMTSGRNYYKMIQAVLSFYVWTSAAHDRQLKMNSRIYDKLKNKRSEYLKWRWDNDADYRFRVRAGLEAKISTPAYKEYISQKRKELWQDPVYINKMKNRPRQVKSVEIDGTIYSSLKEAGMHLGIDASTVSKRCSSNKIKYNNWKYV